MIKVKNWYRRYSMEYFFLDPVQSIPLKILKTHYDYISKSSVMISVIVISRLYID